ncbi:MAG: hypothetical protein H0U92_00400 [Actinobacteria bacterium]|nr:hypothetical protein [Actinomycetota bacterium]
MTISVSPSSGPPGTVMQIYVTGCNDPDGLNHAISFNDAPVNHDTASDPNTVQTINSTQDGDKLTATYAVVASDQRGQQPGRVFVQCEATLKWVDFTVTG